MTLVEEVAKAIYDKVFLPGQEDGYDDPMPSWEDGVAHDIGGIERANNAAQAAIAATIKRMMREVENYSDDCTPGLFLECFVNLHNIPLSEEVEVRREE